MSNIDEIVSNAARDVVEIIEATESTERKRAAEIVLKYVIDPIKPKKEEYWLNDVLKDIANEIVNGE